MNLLYVETHAQTLSSTTLSNPEQQPLQWLISLETQKLWLTFDDVSVVDQGAVAVFVSFLKDLRHRAGERANMRSHDGTKPV
jgi:anti-anti-sigma regulatory factor